LIGGKGSVERRTLLINPCSLQFVQLIVKVKKTIEEKERRRLTLQFNPEIFEISITPIVLGRGKVSLRRLFEAKSINLCCLTIPLESNFSL
jgi:hypothetical protein